MPADPLDRLLDAGRDLLVLVDTALLAGGAPAGHPIWPAARRVGALPGDALDSLAALRPEPLLGGAEDVRALIDGYERQRAALAGFAGTGVWEGRGAAAFSAQVQAFVAHLGGAGEESMIGRLTATAGYLSEIASWVTASRRALAEALADALVSAEAVRVRAADRIGTRTAGPDRAEALAAATIGARVLEAVAQALDSGRVIRERWAGRLGELTFRPAVEGEPPAVDAGTRAVL